MVRVRIKPEKGFAKTEMKKLQDDLEKFAPSLAEKWATLVQRAFAEHGYPTRWAPLKRSTIKRKLSAGYPLDPLVRTGKMRASYEFAVGKEAKGIRITVTNKTKYWKFHETGTRFMPARPQANPKLYEKEFTEEIVQKLNAKAV